MSRCDGPPHIQIWMTDLALAGRVAADAALVAGGLAGIGSAATLQRPASNAPAAPSTLAATTLVGRAVAIWELCSRSSSYPSSPLRVASGSNVGCALPTIIHFSPGERCPPCKRPLLNAGSRNSALLIKAQARSMAGPTFPSLPWRRQ